MDRNEYDRLGDIHVLGLLKGDEHYVFVFKDGYFVDVLRTFCRFASHPELSMTWYDASLLKERVMAILNEDLGG
jgi:hypothetical protein